MTMPREWTFDEICESQDFNHEGLFVEQSALTEALAEIERLNEELKRKAIGKHLARITELESEIERAETLIDDLERHILNLGIHIACSNIGREEDRRDRENALSTDAINLIAKHRSEK